MLSSTLIYTVPSCCVVYYAAQGGSIYNSDHSNESY